MDGLSLGAPAPAEPTHGASGWLPLLGLPVRWIRLLRRKPVAPTLLERLSAPLDDLLALLFQEVAGGIAVVDRAGQIVRVNDALTAMARNAVDTMPGRPATGLFAPARRDEAWADLSSALSGRRTPRPFVSVMSGQEGDLTVTVSAIPLREADGAVSGLILRVSDITAQRQLEAQLTQSQKLQALGQLAGGIAHDFNNLLTAILGAADEQLNRGTLDGEAVQDMVQIRRSAERGAALVRQLLAFGRQQTLQPRVVSLHEIVEDMSGLLRRLLGGRVILQLDMDPSPARICVDPTQLEQVLVNLAVNARDAMQEGGTLTLHSGNITLFRPLTLGVETIPPGRYAMLEVRDTGTGIDPQILPRIFDPFFTTKRDRGGHGLGLSTVHGIVRQSGGFLGLDSTPGSGTSVRIYLPREDDNTSLAIPHPPAPRSDACPMPVAPVPPDVPVGPAPPDPPVRAPVAAGGRRVLLVDDEAPVRQLGERALVKRGWVVLAAASAEEALALVPTGTEVDIVVSDVVMPGMDGPALVRALRALRPGLPAVLASGYAEEALRADMSGPGLHFISKPYSLKQLAALMENVMAEQTDA